MGKNSKILWTDHTFNPWWGCVKVSEGCANCYAETFSNRFGNFWGKDAPRRFFGDKHWNDPIRWNREAEKLGVRYKVFCGSMCDVFEDRKDLLSPRMRLFTLIEATPNLDWLLLTKRPENFDLLPCGYFDDEASLPDNVWLGVTVENQKQAEIRIPKLLEIPAKIRWLSCEPLLGELELEKIYPIVYGKHLTFSGMMDMIDWIIVGGESGNNARQMKEKWALELKRICTDDYNQTAFFVKQMGTHWAKENGYSDDAKGLKEEYWLEELRVKQYPGVFLGGKKE